MIDKRLAARCLQLVAAEVEMGQIEMRQAVGKRDKATARKYIEVMTEAFRVVYSFAEVEEEAPDGRHHHQGRARGAAAALEVK